VFSTCTLGVIKHGRKSRAKAAAKDHQTAEARYRSAIDTSIMITPATPAPADNAAAPLFVEKPAPAAMLAFCAVALLQSQRDYSGPQRTSSIGSLTTWSAA